MKHDYVKAFEELKALAGKYYEDIDDPDKYIYELRHGERDEIAVQTRQDTLKQVGEWIDNHVIIATEQEEVIPGKLSVSTATYGFHTKEWHELLDSLKRGEMPEQSGT